MHVHVVGLTGEAKVWIDPGIELARSHGFSERTVRTALKLIKEREDEIRTAWTEHFGS